MDYLFYGNVTTSKRNNTRDVLLNIYCEMDEILNVYELASTDFRCLAYKKVSAERHADSLTAIFNVPDNQLTLLIIAGQSNETDIPFEVTYAIYGGEVIVLPENNIVQLKGSVYIFSDGERKVCQ